MASTPFSIEEVIAKAKTIHKDSVDYSLIDKRSYRGTHISRVPLRCLKDTSHGVFHCTMHEHINGRRGCAKCAKESSRQRMRRAGKNRLIPLTERIHQCEQVLGPLYDYSRIHEKDYKSCHSRLTVVCRKHLLAFYASFQGLLRGESKCRLCANESSRKEFIEKATKVHGSNYDYYGVEWRGSRPKVLIHCLRCNKPFLQSPGNHLHGSGCPRCKRSKGEERVAQCLEYRNIKYESQKTFPRCVGNTTLKGHRRKLPFDFYLTDYNLCIEYDGEGHYMPIRSHGSGGLSSFQATQQNDAIKTQFCVDNKIVLIRIPFTLKKDIDIILDEILIKEIGNG